MGNTPLSQKSAENTDVLKSKSEIISTANNGDTKTAFRLAQHLLERVGDDPEIMELAGILASNSGLNEEAIKLFRGLTEHNPTQVEYHDKLIRVLLAHDRSSGQLVTACTNALAAVGPNATYFHALGISYAEMEKHREAILAFDDAISINPNFKLAHRAKSVPLMMIGDHEEAIIAFTNSLENWDRLLPTDYRMECENNYDRMSHTYDQNSLHQQFSEILAEIAKPMLYDRSNLDVLDAGCGTGAMGERLRSFSRFLHGIDLSNGMLSVARKKNIYHELSHGDMSTEMAKLPRKFDIITSCCALYHVADLKPIFEQTARLLRTSGFFFFSVDPSTDKFDIAMIEPGEYAHSRRYLRKLANTYGFTEIGIYIKTHRRFPGFICAFRRVG